MLLSSLKFLMLASMVSGTTQDIQRAHCWQSFKKPIGESFIYGVDSSNKEIKLNNQLELADYLGISRNPSWTQKTSGCGQTLLFKASTPEEIIGFVERGFDPNHVSDIGTPLEVARAQGRYDLVDALLESGADQ